MDLKVSLDINSDEYGDTIATVIKDEIISAVKIEVRKAVQGYKRDIEIHIQKMFKGALSPGALDKACKGALYELLGVKDGR